MILSVCLREGFGHNPILLKIHTSRSFQEKDNCIDEWALKKKNVEMEHYKIIIIKFIYLKLGKSEAFRICWLFAKYSL